MSSECLSGLNQKQQQAVSSPDEHRLVLAGAGSGKTRVLVHRIAWLLETQPISPYRFLAVTFTNKAAHEMRTRIEQLRGASLSGMWVGTFHGLAHRLLRAHFEAAGLPQDFQILDTDDQARLVKRAQRSLEIDETKFPPKQAQWFINQCKESGKRPSDIGGGDYFQETMCRIYSVYHDTCQKSGLVDFSELLLRSLELLENNADIREHYQERFKYLLIDEFQDTNTIQYRWIKALCSRETVVMAVGDDDQSIYSWRGAKVANMQRFTEEFQPCEMIRLEQNYRSTQTILEAANAVISHNQDRLGKNLWTEGNQGEAIQSYAAFNEKDEAYYIASVVSELKREGRSYQEMAVLYRSNAQSRVIEERLLQRNIPYRIYGGQKFFERAEIKDILAYLRLLVNPHDDASFERVVNLPTRGIGHTTINRVREVAKEEQLSMMQAVEFCCSGDGILSKRAQSSLLAFVALIQELSSANEGDNLTDITQLVIDRTHLMDHYKKDKSEKGLSRIENIEELVNATSQFEPSNEELSLISDFLSQVALETGETQADAQTEGVSLMTLHAAKGLEFSVVFMVGLEENLFPHKMSVEEPQGLAEERRLCYVGMTRAKEKLYLTYAKARQLYGQEHYHDPSRFLKEIPDNLVSEVRSSVSAPRPQHKSNAQGFKKPYVNKSSASALGGVAVAGVGLKVGQTVTHKKFGKGIVTNYEGQGAHARIQVDFNRHGSKWLMASFANLTPL